MFTKGKYAGHTLKDQCRFPRLVSFFSPAHRYCIRPLRVWRKSINPVRAAGTFVNLYVFMYRHLVKRYLVFQQHIFGCRGDSFIGIHPRQAFKRYKPKYALALEFFRIG